MPNRIRLAVLAGTLMTLAACGMGKPTPRFSGEIAPGGRQDGRLEGGDETLQTNEFADFYRFQGSQGQRITISLWSDDFDAYVFIHGPRDFQSDNDDGPQNEEGDTHAELVVTLPHAGEYWVCATTYRPGEAGAYTLMVE